MAYKHCCVVDEQGDYRALVLVLSPSGTFGEDASIYAYHLPPGEKLIDTKAPGGAFCKPRWDGEWWSEGATEEELAAWEAERALGEA